VSTPNHSVAEDRENKPNSAPKRLLGGTEGDLASASLDKLRCEWRLLYRSEPPRVSRDLLYGGVSYPSLTKVAKEITGAYWSGPRFFRPRASRYEL
jgi:hypothetical protein